MSMAVTLGAVLGRQQVHTLDSLPLSTELVLHNAGFTWAAQHFWIITEMLAYQSAFFCGCKFSVCFFHFEENSVQIASNGTEVSNQGASNLNLKL